MSVGAGGPFVVALLLVALFGFSAASAAAQEDERAPATWPLCRADLVVEPGAACRYPERSDHFVVRPTGEARFLFFRDFRALSVPGWRIDGEVVHFSAHAQGDGSWLIASVEPPPDGGPQAGGVFALAESHGAPTGMWSDGETLWLLENATGALDSSYAYPLGGEPAESGAREPTMLTLAEANAVPRGLWSDGAVLLVADSGAGRVFAYDAQSGERAESREFALAAENAEARGIWSDGQALWALDAAGVLFAYDLATGDPLGRHALDPENASPHGLWSDGTTLWVSDHDGARLFAYRLPGAPADSAALERSPDDDVTALMAAGNSSPRGIWSDGRTIYVADANDDRVYGYDLPARTQLAALSLRGLELGGFRPGETAYEAAWGAAVRVTTVEARAADGEASVAVAPADADGDPANGHQVALGGLEEVTVTVTSPDGTRARVYRVRLPRGDGPSCLRGEAGAGRSLVVYEGGSVAALERCAQGRGVTALYALHEGEWLSYILDAPAFANAGFTERFSAGVPAWTALLAASAGPPSPDPHDAPAGGAQGWPRCLLGQLREEGFSLAVYEGGGLASLERCAESLGVAALYALDEGEWVSYVPGAPALVNRPFGELFGDGLPALTPLLVTEEAPPRAGSLEETADESRDGRPERAARAGDDAAGEEDGQRPQDSTSGPGGAAVIGNTGGVGVSHRNDCADGARLPRFGWAEGDAVEVLGEGVGRCAGWLRVRADGVASWVREEYVSGFAGALPDTPRRVFRAIGDTGGVGVSHRHDCADEARLPRFGWAEGDAVEVLAAGHGRCADWLLVRAGGVTSWVREQYLPAV
ncbi:MAG: cadherin-like beta sandwich domain-containing protein [Chloroflexi bacterium]|nr:cadherin-like beta sandwich domain-containing protein [Chloroflexota bacterium]